MIVFRLIGNIRDRQGRGLQCCPLRPPRAGLTVPTRVGQTAVGTVTGAGTEGGSVCSGQLAGWGKHRAEQKHKQRSRTSGPSPPSRKSGPGNFYQFLPPPSRRH